MNKRKKALLAVLLTSMMNHLQIAIAGGPSLGQTWHYRLLGDSSVIKAIDTGGAPTIVRTAPLRGGFDLVGEPTSSPGVEAFTLTNIQFAALADDLFLSNGFTGTGTFQISGALIQFQNMDLQLQMFDGTSLHLTNLNQTASRYWPMVEIKVVGELYYSYSGGVSIIT